MTFSRMRISTRLFLLLGVFASLVSGCIPAGPAAAQTPGPGPADASELQDLVPGRVTVLATGLDMPWGLTFLPDGSALVSGRHSAEISHIPPQGGTATLVGQVPGVDASAEGGLLGLAASPDFATDRTVFAYVSSSPTNRVVTLRIAGDLRSLSQERIVLDGIVTSNRHHGGRLRFGPDGNLWITTGDAFEPEAFSGRMGRFRPAIPSAHRSSPPDTATSRESRSDRTGPSTPPSSG